MSANAESAKKNGASGAYRGLLFLGDPHIASRPPGYRTESYQEEILAKLAWALDYARRERLKPALLGDLFHWPRDNANALVVALLRLFGGLDEPLAMIAGNHDMRHAPLREEDTLAILETAGVARILDNPGGAGPWVGAMGGRRVLLGGTSWGKPLPTKSLPDAATALIEAANAEGADADTLVVWMTHHDLSFPNAEKSSETRDAAEPPDDADDAADSAQSATEVLAPETAPASATSGTTASVDPDGRPRVEQRPAPALEGVDIAVNGHIHRPVLLAAGVAGRTHWFNPGNIARITRSSHTHDRKPGLLRIDIAAGEWRASRVEIPVRPFAEVFHDAHLADATPDGSGDGEFPGDSSFVRGLEALRSRRTAGGQGLWDFLDANLGEIDPEVAEEIRLLARRALAEAGLAPEDVAAAPPRHPDRYGVGGTEPSR